MPTRAKAIQSQIKELSSLQLFPFPGRPFAVARAARVGTVYVAVSDKGRVYTSQATNSPCYWNSVNRMAPTIQALVAMGMVSPEAMAKHRAAEENEREYKDARRAAGDILEARRAAGLVLTAEQLAHLCKLTEPPKPVDLGG